MLNIRLFSLFFCCCSLTAWSQNGWESVRNNDHIAARKNFEATLQKDSLNKSALQGLIYLSELEQDKISYKKYINRLLREYPEEHPFWLFKGLYTGLSEEIPLGQDSFSERIKFPARLSQARKLRNNRKFIEATAAYQQLNTPFHWSLIGPFKNVAGSGHVTAHAIEKEAFDKNKVYKNHKGLRLKWVQPRYMDQRGKVHFEDHLPGASGDAVYYANTFFEVNESATYQLRISRSSPIKIWIDDALVYAHDREIKFDWDTEVLKLKLEKGTHRLLVKSSSGIDGWKNYSLFRFFDNNNESSNLSWYANWYNGYNNKDVFFGLRFSDKKGTLAPQITPAENTAYKPGNYKAEVLNLSSLHYFQEAVAQDPETLFNYYLLNKAALKSGRTKEWESFFVEAYRKNPDLVFFQHLMAKIYAQNGKIEKAYAVLSEVEHEKTPVFTLLYDKFKDIDLKNEEERYLEALEQLKKISPSNYSVIQAYLDYYDNKGLQAEKKTFIEEMKEKYPEHDDRLAWEEEDDNRPYQSQTDKEKKHTTKNALKGIKKNFYTYDYTRAIEHYTAKSNSAKVLQLYAELIRIIPYNVYYRKEKADFLYAEDRFEEALKELEVVLEISPYDAAAFETMGDIYADMEEGNDANDQQALAFYHKARTIGGASYNLEDKIAKLEGQNTLKKLFTTKTFEEVLGEVEDWEEKYPEEDAVVLMYTRDLIYDTTAYVEVYQQYMVKILNDDGAKAWTEADFSFIGNINSVKVVKTSGTELFPDRKRSHVVFKNLEAGDVIQIDGDYRWKQSTELDQELTSLHYVSFNYPIHYKKYEVAMPKGMCMNALCHRLEDVKIKSTQGIYDHYRWEFHDLPKVENETATLDEYDMYANIMISSMPDWAQVVNWYLQKTYQRLDMTYEVQEALDSIVTDRMSDLQKVEAIYNYLTKEINYSYVPFLQSGYIPKEVGLTLSAGIGDCKDVASLMIVMLRACGIDAHYTLVKTNAYNHLNMVPSLYFDHVVVYYETKDTSGFLDMTTDFYPYYVLTENDINAWALIIREGEKNIFQLPLDDLNPKKNLTQYEIKSQLDINRDLTVQVDAVFPGVSGGGIREELSRISQDEQRNQVLEMLGEGVFQQLTLSQHQFKNTSSISEPLEAHFELKATNFADDVTDLLVCRIPYMTSALPHAVFASEVRHNRLNLSELIHTEPTLQKVQLDFPKGYQLRKLPKDIHITSRFGDYRVHFQKTKNGIAVEKRLVFHSKIVEVNDFDAFKKFYFQVLDADNTKIALQPNNQRL